MQQYRRHLPHWVPDKACLFITWRLWGSLPEAVLKKFEAEREREERLIARTTTDQGNYVGAIRRAASVRFARLDRILDKAASGPIWLKRPGVAQLAADTLVYGEARLKLYRLHAYVVMANHVHALLEPRASLARIMKAVKGYTAREANRLLDREGKHFWQDESFDHWIRSEAEFVKTVRYIERNPVTAGLVSRPEDWPWSSAPSPRPQAAIAKM
jgi:putative DNA methylase